MLDPLLDADPSLMDKRILLHSAGVLPSPPTSVCRRACDCGWTSFRLSASTEVVDALTLQLECLTGWGTRLVDVELVPHRYQRSWRDSRFTAFVTTT